MFHLCPRIHLSFLFLLFFRFIYADILAADMWAAAETPYMSGNFTTQKVNFTCSEMTPIPCSFVGSTSIPKLAFILSIGQDNNKDLFYITQTGVYRIVRSVHCGFKCNKSWFCVSLSSISTCMRYLEVITRPPILYMPQVWISVGFSWEFLSSGGVLLLNFISFHLFMLSFDYLSLCVAFLWWYGICMNSFL